MSNEAKRSRLVELEAQADKYISDTYGKAATNRDRQRDVALKADLCLFAAHVLAGQQGKLPPDPDAHDTDVATIPSPSILPVFTEEEIERIADQMNENNLSDQRDTDKLYIKDGLRYANTRAVSVDKMLGEAKDSEVAKLCEDYADNYMIEGRITVRSSAMKIAINNFLRTRLTSLFNGEG